jgi:hypothetical protein
MPPRAASLSSSSSPSAGKDVDVCGLTVVRYVNGVPLADDVGSSDCILVMVTRTPTHSLTHSLTRPLTHPLTLHDSLCSGGR